MAQPAASVPTSATVLVIGGGNAGISLAAHLLHDGVDDVVIIEPKDEHQYRPLLSYVGSGKADLPTLTRPQASVMPDGATWVRDAVTAVDPRARSVALRSGARIGYDQLVICPGSVPDWAAVLGSREAVETGAAVTNYVPALAPGTWEQTRALRSGTAVFTIPDMTAPCPGVAYKPLFMACDHWQQQGVLADIDVVLLAASPQLFGIAQIDRLLQEAVERYGITVRTGVRLSGVDDDGLRYRLRGTGTRSDDGTDGPERLQPFDLLHLVPPFQAPAWVREAGLAREFTSPDATGMDPDAGGGFVDVDPATLRHRTFAQVWSLGDAAAAGVSRSGAGLRKQTAVVAENLAAVLKGCEPTATYSGYSASPITVSASRLIFAEHLHNTRLKPLNRLTRLYRPKRFTWLFDRYGLPWVYWNRILKGKA